jgi:hypothetical protein
VLEDEFVSVYVLVEGPGSGKRLFNSLFLKTHHGQFFSLLSLDVAVSVAAAGVRYVGQKFLIRTDISIALQNRVAKNPAVIFAGLAEKLRDMLIIPGKF